MKKNTINISNKNNIKKTENQIYINRKWTKIKEFSCLYDSFIFIYTFCIRNEINFKLNNNLSVIDIIQEDILKAILIQLDNGIWDIIDKYIANYNFLNINYKEYNTINQLFELFNKIDIFCFKYISKEGCNKCLFSENKVNYLNPKINYDLAYFNLFSFERLIYFLLKNDIYICPKKMTKLLMKILKIIIKLLKICPNFIFIGFDLSLPEDLLM